MPRASGRVFLWFWFGVLNPSFGTPLNLPGEGLEALASLYKKHGLTTVPGLGKSHSTYRKQGLITVPGLGKCHSTPNFECQVHGKLAKLGVNKRFDASHRLRMKNY